MSGQTRAESRGAKRPALLAIGVFSLLYFLDVCLHSAQKYFWYDELLTVYFSRLPGITTLWGALSTRLPEILGFWIFCLCLFRFVNKRVGALGGFIAMAFPMLTGGLFYAIEARPHALVAGLCGVALVCWDEAANEDRRNWWLAGFSFCLLAAFLLHCYALLIAIPFACAELTLGIQLKRVDWKFWIALCAPVCIAGLSYVPLLVFYRGVSSGASFERIFSPNWNQVRNFYFYLFRPSLALFLLIFVLLAIDHVGTASRRGVSAAREYFGGKAPELALAVGFAALPLFGVMLGKLVHGPFFARYFLSSLIGFCVLVGIASASQASSRWVASALAAVMACTITIHVSRLILHRQQGWSEPAGEPSSGFAMNTAHGALDRYKLLLNGSGNSAPIAILEPLDFLYLVHYAPELAPRLYYVTTRRPDSFVKSYQRFQPWASVKYNPELSSDQFRKSASDFFVYGSRQVDELSNLARGGAEIKSLKFGGGRFLAEVQMPERAPKPR